MAKLAKSTLVSQSPHFRPQAIIHRQPLRTSQSLTCACHSGVTSLSTTTTALKGATPSSRGGASPGFRCRYLGASMYQLSLNRRPVASLLWASIVRCMRSARGPQPPSPAYARHGSYRGTSCHPRRLSTMAENDPFRHYYVDHPDVPFALVGRLG